MASFTTTCPGIAQSLRNEVGIKDPVAQGDKKFIALWDTGATNCVITKSVATQLGLVEVGRIQAHILPNGIRLVRQVTEGISGGCWDVLIGMDVITLGDFCVSNYNGVTVFSFRMPSKERTDYVQLELNNPAKT